MKEILYYTRKPIDSVHYDARIAYSMHLAIREGDGFTALNHNSGVLFALATENEDGSLNPKCLRNPFITEKKTKDGFYVLAVRTDGEGCADTEDVGGILLWETKDLIKYKEIGMIHVSDTEVERIYCEYDEACDDYRLMWSAGGKWYKSILKDMTGGVQVDGISSCDEPSSGCVETDIEGARDCAVIRVSDEIADRLVKKLTVAYHIGNEVSDTIRVSSKEELEDIRIRALYSDGTSALKRVDWDVCGIDFDKSGEYYIKGVIHKEHYEFPVAYNRADPCIGFWNGKYYFIATNDADNNHSLYVREADSIPELVSAEEKLILDSDMYDYAKGLLWAPEFHEIDGKLYIFLALTPGEFFCEESHVMELCDGGNPSNKDDWSAPKRVVKWDGTDLCEMGREITLDMTCFKWQDEYYAVWSQRQFLPKDLGAWLYIAKIDRNEPWKLITEPVVLSKPDYGWANNHTFVDEGPFALIFEDRIVLTFSSAAVDTSYVVSMLTIEKGKDLLVRENWEKNNYPILTSRSVPGEFGTGHNAYVVDEYGDIWNTYHARPGEEGVRSSGIRRVHFDTDSMPVLDMTEELDVSPEHAVVYTKLIVEGAHIE